MPKEFKLNQNYPNPFNPSTTIKFSVPKDGNVSLKVYGINGGLVKTLVNQRVIAGNYSADFDATGISSGIYFYKIDADGFVQTKKMILIK